MRCAYCPKRVRRRFDGRGKKRCSLAGVQGARRFSGFVGIWSRPTRLVGVGISTHFVVHLARAGSSRAVLVLRGSGKGPASVCQIITPPVSLSPCLIRATHLRILHHALDLAALAFVPFGIALIRVRVRLRDSLSNAFHESLVSC